jgi:hypothetical protein
MTRLCGDGCRSLRPYILTPFSKNSQPVLSETKELVRRLIKEEDKHGTLHRTNPGDELSIF